MVAVLALVTGCSNVGGDVRASIVLREVAPAFALAGGDAAAPPVARPPVAPPATACPEGYRCDYGRLARAPAAKISEVRLAKSTRTMHLLADGVVVRTYSVALGWGGAGPKRREGDGVTPTGTYTITGTLATSPWHVLVGVSYPNYEDVKRHAALKAKGEIPHDAGIGFGIAIHGRAATQKDGEHKRTDWTLGCIALDNPEIEELSRLVHEGTPIVIAD